MRRLLTYGGVLAGLLIATVVAYLAFAALHLAPQVPGNGGVTEICSPGPCADIQGYTLWVSNVQVTANLVTMTVKFKNSSPSTHASPEDLQLIDAGRHTAGITTDTTGCNTWTRHEFNNGATFGPINICFRVFNATPPFILHWTPDLGVFCCDTDIKLT
ncbi:MAG: hypothetical protein ABI334_01725 [Candidatus Dormiibacterota bacterium]